MKGKNGGKREGGREGRRKGGGDVPGRRGSGGTRPCGSRCRPCPVREGGREGGKEGGMGEEKGSKIAS